MTFLTRLIPFILFKGKKETPKSIRYIGNYLPPAVIAMLIIYSIKNISIIVYPYGIPEIIGIAAVVLLHLYKRNNLLSIVGGTIIYMILVQYILI